MSPSTLKILGAYRAELHRRSEETLEGWVIPRYGEPRLNGRACRLLFNLFEAEFSGHDSGEPCPLRAWTGKAGGSLKSKPPLRFCVQCYLPMGEGCALSDNRYFVHHLSECDSIRTEILRQAIPCRYLLAVYMLSQCSGATTGRSSGCNNEAVMKSEKLKSTTVRFTDSDLYLIERLQQKLGLGMIHVIRLAIRRLAENENVLSSVPKKH